MTTEERVEKLEKELSKMRAGLTVANVICANKFVLADDQGRSRAMLVVSEDGPTLSLRDEKGKTILSAPR